MTLPEQREGSDLLHLSASSASYQYLRPADSIKESSVALGRTKDHGSVLDAVLPPRPTSSFSQTLADASLGSLGAEYAPLDRRESEGGRSSAASDAAISVTNNPAYRYSSASEYDNDPAWRSLLDGARNLGSQSPMPGAGDGGSSVSLTRHEPYLSPAGGGATSGATVERWTEAFSSTTASMLSTGAEHRWAGDYTSPGGTPPPAPSPRAGQMD